MTVGTLTITALAGALLATLVWWAAGRLGLPDWAQMLLFAAAIILAVLAGPLVRLP